MSGSQNSATCGQIKEPVLQEAVLKVTSLWIPQLIEDVCKKNGTASAVPFLCFIGSIE